MEITYVKEFIVLAEEGQFVSASNRLFISQSALSRHIQALEKELGCNLFERTTRDVTLAKEGKLFLPFARNIVDNNDAFASELHLLREKKENISAVGIVHDPEKWNVTKYIDEFLTSYPEVRLNITECSLAELKDKLAKDELHVVTMAYAPWQTLPENFVLAGISRLVAIVAKDHPLANKSCLKLEDLKDEPLCVPFEKSYTYNYFLHALKNNTPNIIYKGNSHGINELIKSNRCILIQDQNLVSDKLTNEFTTLKLEPDVVYYYGLEYNNNLNKNERLFVNYIRQRCRDIKLENLT